MNRRAFFTSLAAIAAGATLDPERLLWVPGRKLISIPQHPASFLRGPWPVANIIAEAQEHLAGFPPLMQPEDYAFALRRLNSLFDQWNSEPIWIPR